VRVPSWITPASEVQTHNAAANPAAECVLFTYLARHHAPDAERPQDGYRKYVQTRMGRLHKV